jgi:hypothetical protein
MGDGLAAAFAHVHPPDGLVQSPLDGIKTLHGRLGGHVPGSHNNLEVPAFLWRSRPRFRGNLHRRSLVDGHLVIYLRELVVSLFELLELLDFLEGVFVAFPPCQSDLPLQVDFVLYPSRLTSSLDR